MTLDEKLWGGQASVTGLLSGTNKYNDPGFLAAFDALSKWAPYLGKGFEAETYSDSQNLFTSGKAAIFPAGSWEIAGFEQAASFTGLSLDALISVLRYTKIIPQRCKFQASCHIR